MAFNEPTRSYGGGGAGGGGAALAALPQVAALDSPRSPRPPQVGVSLRALQHLVASHGGRAAFERGPAEVARASGRDAAQLLPPWLQAERVVTTEVVKYVLVKPDTQAHGCSYAELLLASDLDRGGRGGGGGSDDAGPLVGAANAFISHAYSYAFLDVLDAVTAWAAAANANEGAAAEGPRTFFFYFDLLVVNQHGQGAVVTPAVLLDEFGHGVRSAGRTILLLDWRAPVPLSRVWCVFEIFMTLSSGLSFEIFMPPPARAAFLAALVADFAAIVNSLCTVDVATAKAFVDVDRATIQDAIVQAGGFLRVNQLVIGAMRDFMAHEGAAALAGLSPGDREGVAGADLKLGVASLHFASGEFARAEAFAKEALATRERLLGERAAPTIACMHVVASYERKATGFYSTPGDHVERRLRRALELARAAEPHGALALLVATCMDELGMHLLQQTRELQGGEFSLSKPKIKAELLAEVEVLLVESIALRKHLLSDGAPDVLSGASNLALFYTETGRHLEASKLLQNVLAGRRLVLPEGHPDTLSTMESLAINFHRSAIGRTHEAEALFLEALAGHRRTLGDAHPETLGAIGNVGLLMLTKGELGKAEELCRESFVGMRRAFGGADLRVAEHAASLHSVLVKAGKDREAREVAAELAAIQLALSISENGESSTRTLMAQERLGKALQRAGRASEAEACLRNAVAGYIAPDPDNAGAFREPSQPCRKSAICSLARLLLAGPAPRLNRAGAAMARVHGEVITPGERLHFISSFYCGRAQARPAEVRAPAHPHELHVVESESIVCDVCGGKDAGDRYKHCRPCRYDECMTCAAKLGACGPESGPQCDDCLAAPEPAPASAAALAQLEEAAALYAGCVEALVASGSGWYGGDSDVMDGCCQVLQALEDAGAPELGAPLRALIVRGCPERVVARVQAVVRGGAVDAASGNRAHAARREALV